MSDLRECMRNLLCDELFNWAFGDDDEDDQESDDLTLVVQQLLPWLKLHLMLQQVPPIANQTHFLSLYN